MAAMVKEFIKRNRAAYLLLFPFIWLRRRMAQRQYDRVDRSYESMFGQVEEGSLVVRIPQFGGSFEIDARSHALKRALLGTLDGPDRTEFAARLVAPQKDVVDVGASVGTYTVVFSKAISPGNKVLSVEPTPRSSQYLRRNVERNGVADSVIIFQGVAADAKRSYRINVVPGREDYSSLGDMVHPSIRGESSQTIDVDGDTVDNLVNQFKLSPGLIKIDAEGAEYLVLTGAKETLKTHRPVILSELSDLMLGTFGHTSPMVVELLEAAGYDVSDALNPGAPVVAPFHGDILAVPRERPSARPTT